MVALLVVTFGCTPRPNSPGVPESAGIRQAASTSPAPPPQMAQQATPTPTGEDGRSGACSESTCVDTAECIAYCNNVTAQCGASNGCDEKDRKFFCRIQPGEGPASTRARLGCRAKAKVQCSPEGWSIKGCAPDNRVCKADRGGGPS